MGKTPKQPPSTPTSPEENNATALYNKTAAALFNKNRALKVIRHCNQVMFQADTEQELLDEICRIVVKDTGYLLTWIGYPEQNEAKSITPVAHCGYEEGYLESLQVTWDDSDSGHGPAGMAIQTKQPFVVRDIHVDPNFIPWRKAALERGYSSVASFPLFIDEELPAVILMYAAEENAFEDDELELLIHFSETLSYGIQNIRMKEKNSLIEQALRKNEQRFRFMLDTSPIAVRIAVNRGHSIVYSNSSYNTLMNTNSTKILGANPRDFYVNKNEYDAIVNVVERGQTVTNRLVNFSVPQEGDKWTLSTYLPILFEGEEAVLGWFYDITDRKHKEDAMLISEEEYIKAFRTIPEALWISSISDGKFIEVNAGCTYVLGYERNELIGHTSIELNIWPDVEQRNTLMTLVRENGKFNNLEVKFQTKDGSIKDILISGETITIDQQACIILCARDFTERKHVQNELKQLQNYLANIIDSMPSVIIGVDADGNVTQWNYEARRVTGIETKEAEGKHITDVFPRLSTQIDNILGAIKSRNELIDTHKYIRQDGETQYEDITIYPLIANGVDGAVVRLDNVTERVRLEEIMIQSEKMLSVGGLAAGMAHEINNPLAGMMQTASVMSSRLTNKTLPANISTAETTGIDLNALYNYMDERGILRMLEAINESSLRIADIIDNMLTFARKSDVTSLSWNLAELLDKSLLLAATDYDLKQQYDFKSIKIVTEFQDNVPDVECEGSKIQQVFLNLFRNGAQAMQEGKTKHPTFTLRTGYDAKDKMVRVEIEDNGPGMSESTRKRLFEPFFTTKPVGIGTGLGLSVSYFIVAENHHGEMSVVSAVNKGSRFIIRLPLKQPEE